MEELLISVSSEDVTKWKELGEQLKISETLLNRIQNNSVGSKDKTSNVLRYMVHVPVCYFLASFPGSIVL